MSRCIMELETHEGFLQWCEGHIHHLQPQLSALFPGHIQWQTALRFSGNPYWKCQNIAQYVGILNFSAQLYRFTGQLITGRQATERREIYYSQVEPTECKDLTKTYKHSRSLIASLKSTALAIFMALITDFFFKCCITSAGT